MRLDTRGRHTFPFPTEGQELLAHPYLPFRQAEELPCPSIVAVPKRVGDRPIDARDLLIHGFEEDIEGRGDVRVRVRDHSSPPTRETVQPRDAGIDLGFQFRDLLRLLGF